MVNLDASIGAVRPAQANGSKHGARPLVLRTPQWLVALPRRPRQACSALSPVVHPLSVAESGFGRVFSGRVWRDAQQLGYGVLAGDFFKLLIFSNHPLKVIFRLSLT